MTEAKYLTNENLRCFKVMNVYRRKSIPVKNLQLRRQRWIIFAVPTRLHKHSAIYKILSKMEYSLKHFPFKSCVIYLQILLHLDVLRV